MQQNVVINKNRIKGALYGVAVGDALGAPVEFMREADIKKKYGTLREMIGGGWLELKPGEITDDTAMMLCIAKGLMENPADPLEAVGTYFIKWIDSNPPDVGRTCNMSITYAEKNLKTGMDAHTAWQKASARVEEENGGMSGGNGALMRCAAIGVADLPMDEMVRHTKALSEMTHRDDLSTAICVSYNRVLWWLAHKQDDVTDEERRNLLKLIAMSAELQESDLEKDVLRPSGWVKDTAACTLYACKTTDTFEAALVKAVNLGGDADTIGAVTGGLVGALYGYEAIPKRWVKTLPQKVSRQIDDYVKWVCEQQARD